MGRRKTDMELHPTETKHGEWIYSKRGLPLRCSKTLRSNGRNNKSICSLADFASGQFCSTTRAHSLIHPISWITVTLLPIFWSRTARPPRRDRRPKQLPDGRPKVAERPTRPHPTNPESGDRWSSTFSDRSMRRAVLTSGRQNFWSQSFLHKVSPTRNEFRSCPNEVVLRPDPHSAMREASPRRTNPAPALRILRSEYPYLHRSSANTSQGYVDSVPLR